MIRGRGKSKICERRKASWLEQNTVEGRVTVMSSERRFDRFEIGFKSHCSFCALVLSH